MDMKNFVITSLVFALFVFAFVGFGISIQQENGVSDENLIIGNEGNRSFIHQIYSNINDSIGTVQNNASTQYGTFNSDPETSSLLGSIGDFFIGALLGVTKTMMNVITGIFSGVFSPLLKAVGLNEAIAGTVGGVLMAIMFFSLIFMAWRLYRTGQ